MPQPDELGAHHNSRGSGQTQVRNAPAQEGDEDEPEGGSVTLARRIAFPLAGGTILAAFILMGLWARLSTPVAHVGMSPSSRPPGSSSARLAELATRTCRTPGGRERCFSAAGGAEAQYEGPGRSPGRHRP